MEKGNRMIRQIRFLLTCSVIFAVVCPGEVHPQEHLEYSSRKLAANVIIPQSRSFDLERDGKVQVTGITAKIDINDQIAVTELEISLKNPTQRRLEAELIVPVPDSASVRGFDFQGKGLEPSAILLKKEEAQKIYSDIVSRAKDPAILEFTGLNMIRSRVFPVEPGSSQKIRLVYEELLLSDGDRVDYILPRTESLSYSVPWKYEVRIRSEQRISTVYSPSHNIDTVRDGSGTLSVRIMESSGNTPGAFRIYYLLEKDRVSASFIAYPDQAIGGGYFLLLVSPSDESQNAEVDFKRELTLVIDRSGSMRGKKIQQVREAALQILSGLNPEETFNIIVYNEGVDRFSENAVKKDSESVIRAQEYLENIQSRGGTNIHDSLTEALAKKPVEGYLPIVLFLTDGLPTVGKTSEKEIRLAVQNGNPYRKRVFTIGVGLDVNTPLLDKIAQETRGKASYVLDGEDIEVKVASVFKKLNHPVLADLEMKVLNQQENPVPDRIEEIHPSKLADLFSGDQLVILGKYKGNGSLLFKLTGHIAGIERDYRFVFDMDRSSTRNAFVPRLWASRKIAVLIDAIRQFGEGGDATKKEVDMNDPKVKELVDEIVELSVKFGILTEYTAFLAKEGLDMESAEKVEKKVSAELKKRAIENRSGMGSMNQSYNFRRLTEQKTLNFRNSFYDSNMSTVSISTVQQLNDLAFYKRSGYWVDSRIGYSEKPAVPARIVHYGSSEYDTLARELVDQNRQGVLSLTGEVLIKVGEKTVLLKAVK